MAVLKPKICKGLTSSFTGWRSLKAFCPWTNYHGPKNLEKVLGLGPSKLNRIFELKIERGCWKDIGNNAEGKGEMKIG